LLPEVAPASAVDSQSWPVVLIHGITSAIAYSNVQSMTFEEAHRAIKRGNVTSIRKALDGGMDANLSNRFSRTLLMLAGAEGNTRFGELLIGHGADPNKTNDFGEAPSP
jgi:ankyrin repeat protein